MLFLEGTAGLLGAARDAPEGRPCLSPEFARQRQVPSEIGAASASGTADDAMFHVEHGARIAQGRQVVAQRGDEELRRQLPDDG